MSQQYRYVLGVPNFANYEAAAALVRIPTHGGRADYVTVSEDRLVRQKHAYAFPLRGIHQTLQHFGLESLEQVDFIFTDHARLPRWINSGPAYRKLEHDYLKLRLKFPQDRIRVLDHHDAHAGSTFYPSGFSDAAVLIVDSLGSRLNTQTLYHFTPGQVNVVERGDHWGVGRLYSLITGAVLPYGPEKGFGKTMGLAPYGRAQPGPVLEFGAIDSGMTSDYSAFCTRAPLPRIVAAGVRRCEDREQVLDPYFARAAYDVQVECERQMVRMARYAYERTGSKNLCLAGGVALNGLANTRVIEQSPFENVFIPPGCSDTGLSLGLALWGYFREVASERSARVSVSMANAYTGCAYPRDGIRALLDEWQIGYRPVEPEAIAPLLAAGDVVAWFEGGSEFGPRALGHRSILADPRDPGMKDTLNHRVKFREGYRPYAPSILAEHAAEWLHLDRPSPFMLQVVEVREDKRALVPAVTHVDGTTRPQTVTAEANPSYYRMISEFHRRTGVPMVLNTSLNVNREPIVETPIDALLCAFSTAINWLYIEGLLVECQRYADPQLVQRLTAERARRLAAEWTDVTSRHLTHYDTAERDAYLAEENGIAEWHRRYRAKYELEGAVARWLGDGARVAVVGTRAHTRCLYEHVTGIGDLDVRAFAALDDRPGERADFDIYPDMPLHAIDWRQIDAVLVSTHEYQAEALTAARAAAPPGIDVFAMYDDAGDSLLNVLPGRWPVVAGAAKTAASSRLPHVSFDFESHPATPALAERYALIVGYHYCHPDAGLLKGTKSITPDEFDQQLRLLKQNFVCTTMGELLNPKADLPETVAVVAFDDGLKDVVDYALPLLKKWDIPATVHCCSAPFLERRVLNVHRAHLLQAALGDRRFRDEFGRALESRTDRVWEPAPIPAAMSALYPYDDEPTRRFKRLINFELPYDLLDSTLAALFATFVGADAEIVDQLYLSASDVNRCLDAGIEIGVHGHAHQVQSRLDEAAQRQDLQLAADYFRQRFGLRDLHYSYPYGNAGSWNATSTRLLEELGFASATTKIRAIAKPADLLARWQIPRFDVRDVFDATGSLRADQLLALFTAD